MIGVVPKLDQLRVVEEFFELFKTPWELVRAGQDYDVVIVTADEIPDVKANLLLAYGAAAKVGDAEHGFAARAGHRSSMLSYRGQSIPIYGTAAAVEGGTACVSFAATDDSAGVQLKLASERAVMRLGYDLFDEVRILLSQGQPREQAAVPTLDIHIEMLRIWILEAGVPLVEIPPSPAGSSFAVCLTHDVDFVGIRRHRFDHTMWGFLYRSTIGAILNFLKGRLSLGRFLAVLGAALSLPLVYLGWARDFWEPFDWYLRVENGLPSTYFLIPFKRRAGDNVTVPQASRRAAAYDVTDIPEWTTRLVREGCEVGVHGIDAWHSVAKAREEAAQVSAVAGVEALGIRIHWLLGDAETPAVLDRAGYAYDSTVGYNDTVGCRAGTHQVYRPLGATALLELPVHIQDGALFFPRRLYLTEQEAEARCAELIAHAKTHGGALTILWHERSHAPERFWGDFYVKLLERLKLLDCWFATAGRVVGWFAARRSVRFESLETVSGTHVRLIHDGPPVVPPLTIRIHRTPGAVENVAWDGTSPVTLGPALEPVERDDRPEAPEAVAVS